MLDRSFPRALRALLIAFWVAMTAFSTAHASADSLEDPCQHEATIEDAGPPADVDHAFHAAHGCGTCHVHVLPAPAVPVQKPASCPQVQALADVSAAASTRADGPYRPPQA